MSTSSKKKGFFRAFANLLSGKPSDSSESTADKANDNSFLSKDPEPLDLTFVKNFTASGGKFLYCEDHEEAYRYISQIIMESNLDLVYCAEENFMSMLQKASANITNKDLTKASAFCSGCEYLVSFTGGIMISANQTNGKKLNELPETFITIASTSQITENLRSALSGVKNKYKGNIPTQITTIKGPIKLDKIQDTSPAKVCNKDIYLLLLEDQL